MANLSLKHIYKVYPNGAKAVNDFNMQIEDKEFIVFVGPSGCGKSTTLRMIAGLEPITAGELKIGDVVVNGMEPKDRDIAMVFQNYALYPHMSIFENIAFGLRMRKIPDIKRDKEGNPVLDKEGKEIPVMRKYNKQELAEKVNEAAEILGITEYLKRKPKEMSGGQRQRVALGRAIVRQPKVMLLDEPLSNLDAKLRTQMRSEIVKLHKKLQTTFIYVTHDQVEAMTMGTRIAVMKNGFLQQSDTPANLYDYPANEYVAFLVGAPTINFIRDAEIVAGENGYLAQFKGGEIALPESIVKRFENIAAYAGSGKRVTLGIRPEDAKSGDGEIKGKVVKAESGANYAECEIAPDISFTFAADKEYAAGAEICLSLDKDRLHIFDAETRLTLLARDAGYAESGLPDTHFKPLGFVEEESIYYGSKAAKAQNKRK